MRLPLSDWRVGQGRAQRPRCARRLKLHRWACRKQGQRAEPVRPGRPPTGVLGDSGLRAEINQHPASDRIPILHTLDSGRPGDPFYSQTVHVWTAESANNAPTPSRVEDPISGRTALANCPRAARSDRTMRLLALPTYPHSEKCQSPRELSQGIRVKILTKHLPHEKEYIRLLPRQAVTTSNEDCDATSSVGILPIPVRFDSRPYTILLVLSQGVILFRVLLACRYKYREPI
jgi:hypothetical protein